MAIQNSITKNGITCTYTGNAGTWTVNFSASENTGASRSATFTIQAGDSKVEVTVTQSAGSRPSRT